MKLYFNSLHGKHQAFDENGALAAQGHLDLDEFTGAVRFVNELTPPQVENHTVVDPAS